MTESNEPQKESQKESYFIMGWNDFWYASHLEADEVQPKLQDICEHHEDYRAEDGYLPPFPETLIVIKGTVVHRMPTVSAEEPQNSH